MCQPFDPQTFLIIILIIFIFGLVLGVRLGRPNMFG